MSDKLLCPQHKLKQQNPLDGARAYNGGTFVNTLDIRARPDIENIDPDAMGDVMKTPTGRK